jgi:hypothetical protein
MKKFESYSRFLTWPMALLLVALAAGCGGGGGGGDPILGGSGTIAGTAPTVTAVVPLANATGVAINVKKITAAFSKAMDPATLTTASFTLACPAGTPVTGGGAVTYVAAGNIATLPLPAATNLPLNTVCTATVTTAAKDTTGNALASNFVWTFRTGVTADTTRPRVTLTVPATTTPGPTTGVPANTAITAAFNEDMDPTTITTAGTFTVTCSAPCVSPSPTGGAATYVVAGKTATFTPTAALAVGETYTATIKGVGASAATDLAGNALAGGTSTTVAADYVWTFTTAAPDVTPPTVTLVNPLNVATGVCINKTINATFSEAMDSGTITTATFTLAPTSNLAALVAGVVAYDPLTDIASLNPTGNLTASINYTVTIKGGASGVKDVAGNALAVDKVWTFDTGTTTCLAPINMGTAATFGIAAHFGVTNTPTVPITHIEGNVILDPVTSAICNSVAIDAAGGFGLCGGSPPTINGTVISALFDPSNTRATVVADLNAAFLSITPPAGPPAAGSLGSPTNLPAGTTLGAPTGSALVQGDNYFTPGLYQSITSILITGDLTLDAQGDANAVFVFQSSSTVGMAAGAAPPGVHSRILLTGGAKASNVWWQAASDATLGLYSEFQGNILAARDITMLTGATSCGRLMAGAWVGVAAGTGTFIFDSNVVSVPGQPFAPPATYSTTCQ